MTPQRDPLAPVSNPCTDARLKRGYVTVPPFAEQVLQRSRQFVENAEHAMYNKIPPVYHSLFTDLPAAADQYFRFQQFRRKVNFQSTKWPTNVTTFDQLLDSLDLRPTPFARQLCVQQSYVHQLISNKTARIPLPVIKALLEAGAPVELLDALATSHLVLKTEPDFPRIEPVKETPFFKLSLS